MGRIKTARIKRVTGELIAAHCDDFKQDFEENKKIVGRFAKIKSKKIRNIIAGYITRIKRGSKEAS